MKLKIVIEVPMHQERCKSKAMKIAASINGVSSVSIESKTNKMVVIGDGVDPVKLTAALRKKFCYANILTVEEVKPQAEEEAKAKSESEELVEAQSAVAEVPNPVIECTPPYYAYSYHGYPRYYIHEIYDPAPSSNACALL